jgi:hypothetical protein
MVREIERRRMRSTSSARRSSALLSLITGTTTVPAPSG